LNPRKDLNNPMDIIDLGCIEIDFDISASRLPCHMKVVSHKESYDIWWNKFVQENLRRREDVIVPFDSLRKIKKTGDIGVYVPKKASYKKRYKEAYAIIKKVDKEFRESWNEDSRNNPKPKIEDYRDALANEMDWKPTDRTIQRILVAGKAGKL
jgi:hypothetical protein